MLSFMPDFHDFDIFFRNRAIGDPPSLLHRTYSLFSDLLAPNPYKFKRSDPPPPPPPPFWTRLVCWLVDWLVGAIQSYRPS